ncbi:MAG TPA: tetratricopeptide repeat protein [Kofleriaceae bacterium]|jgi:tetratricopeptide (TPR) repeat protein|nr:tetratricopeptide repeat protein [Kofleriaceae bacterium]
MRWGLIVVMVVAGCGGRAGGPVARKPVAQAARPAGNRQPAADNRQPTLGEIGKKAAFASTIQAQGLSVGGWISEDQEGEAADQFVNRASAAFDIGDSDGAAREAQAALYADPGNVAAAVILARAQVALGNLGKAEAVARGAVALPGGEQKAQLWMILGLAAEADGRMEEAVAAYGKATGLDRDYYAAWTNLGALYLRQDSLALAVDAFENAVRLHPDAAAAHCNLGSALRARTADFAAEPQRVTPLLERAEAEYLEAYRIDRTYAPALFNLALMHLDGDASKMTRREQLEFAEQYFDLYRKLIKDQRRGGRADAAPVDEYLALTRSLLARLPK